jgi:hypothetical protein
MGQIITGFHEHNKDLESREVPILQLRDYLRSGHFLQSTFENWESEFLQMAFFVVFTVFLYQRGSSESKKLPDEKKHQEKNIVTSKSPWPVRRGGWILRLYQYSLSIALFLLFAVSFVVHFYGSWTDENEKRMQEGELPIPWTTHVTGSRFWFESFQNWQSEFLSVTAIVVLSIFLRHKGSPQSKPLEAPHVQTGGEN